MCLGIPGLVVEITDAKAMLGTVDVCGIKREVNLACVAEAEPEALVGKWVLLHVGFAMSVIDESEAQKTLEALAEMQAIEHEMDDFSGLMTGGAGAERGDA